MAANNTKASKSAVDVVKNLLKVQMLRLSNGDMPSIYDLFAEKYKYADRKSVV